MSQHSGRLGIFPPRYLANAEILTGNCIYNVTNFSILILDLATLMNCYFIL